MDSSYVGFSSRACLRKALTAAFLAMASSVSGSEPFLYSPILSRSSTSAYFARSARSLAAAALWSLGMMALWQRETDARMSIAG